MPGTSKFFITLSLLLLCNWAGIIIDTVSASSRFDPHHSLSANYKAPVHRPCPQNLHGKICSERGNCTSEGHCLCPQNYVGKACQFDRDAITCEGLRNCVQCQVHESGPYAVDQDGCGFFCKEQPTPVVVDRLVVKRNEILCSFIDYTNDTENGCKFFFKLVNLNYAEKSNQDADVIVVAQKGIDCKTGVNQRHFPQTAIKLNYDEAAGEVSDEIRAEYEEMEYSYTTMFFVFVFVALPFVACVASCIQNFRSLPCGLCNPFKRPSSTYLRNLRPYPGPVIMRQRVDASA